MRRAKTQPSFISHADTKEMRDYQATASMYPPLSREEFVEVSKTFVRGRKAGIILDEEQMLDEMLDGDWSDQHTAEMKDEITRRFRQEVDMLYEDKNMPKDVHDIMTKDANELEDAYDLFIATRHLTRRRRRDLSIEREDGEEALATMVNHNLQFAMACVGRMMKKNRRAKMIGAKELIAVANVGLVLGARQYDPDSGRAFTTYAAFHINGQLYDYLHQEDGNIGIKAATLHEQKQIVAIRQIEESFKERYGRMPRINEIASLSHISPDKVISRRDMPSIRTQSIFAKGNPGKDGSGEDREVFVPDLLGDGDSIEGDLASTSRDEAMETAHAGLHSLPVQQIRIIRMFTGMSDGGWTDAARGITGDAKPMSVRQIARELGLTVNVVERELRLGLASLQDMLADIGIDEDRLFGADDM